MRLSRKGLSALAIGLAIGAAEQRSNAALIYLDTNGITAGSGITNGGSYTWENAIWVASGTGTNATGTYIEGSAPDYAAGTDAGTTAAYTLTANSNHTFAGMFMANGTTTKGGGTITVQGAGTLTLASGAQGFNIASSFQTMIIKNIIAGSGQVEQQGGGQLSLFGANTFTGGVITTGGQTINYNNNKSFGTGVLDFTGTSGQGIVNDGSSGLVIPNNITWGTVNGSSNFVGGTASGSTPGTKWTGNVTLPASGTVTWQSGAAGNVDEFSGIISGASSISISNPGTLEFAGTNTYTGATSLAAGFLELGKANTITKTSSLTLAGGTLQVNGFSQAMSAVPLALSATSTIDFSSLAAEVDFANSATQTWTAGKTLNILGYDGINEIMKFDTSSSGLSATQLGMIEFNGDATTLGKAYLLPDGTLLPEPGSLSLLGIGAMGLAARRRKNV